MTPGLRCENISFNYSKHLDPTLKNVSISLPTGALTTITGASGSGKSTFLYVLSLLLHPTHGAVIWNDTILTDLTDGQRSLWRANNVGFIFQDAMLDPARSVLDNVCEPAVFKGMKRDVAQRRALELLKRFDVDHRVSHKPGEVSGGQAQRVGLCRALLNQPRIVFADEPTGNLDDSSARVVWSALTELATDGTTVVVATHDERLAEVADNRIRL